MAKNPPSFTSSNGFAEDQAKYEPPPNLPQHWKLKVAPDGRFVIPAAARAAMEIGAEGNVTAILEDGELHIVSPRVAIRKLQAFIKAHDKGTGSPVDELIAERRAAAARGD
jgi:bifunctional DNA-binding transcriptional regulator/antitoxin component of YhaV-PrlF toxin-antitoxin module